MLELIHRPLVFLHIITGTIAMLASIVAYVVPKYSKYHQQSGRVFYWSMLVTSIGIIPPAIHSEKWVLLFLSVFSFHLTFTGKRYLAFRRKELPTTFDRLAAGSIIIFGVLLIVTGVPLFTQQVGIIGAISPVTFGTICIVMGRQDFQWFGGKDNTSKRALRMHIGRMSGASISAFTAFLVNVNLNVPGGLMWIIPSIVGSLIMAYFMRKVRLGQPIR